MNGQGLTFRFGTDLEPAKRALTTFAGHAGTQLALVGGAAVAASRNMDSLNFVTSRSINGISRGISLYTNYKLAMLGVAVGAAAFSAAVGIAANAVEKLNAIASGSRAAGVDSTFFQVWEKQADKLQVKVEDLRAALTKAREATAMKVDENGNREDNGVTKYVRNLTSLQGANGREVVTGAQLDAVTNSVDPQKRIEAVLDAMRKLHEEADRVNNQDLRLMAEKLGTMTFGNVGQQISDAISRGEMDMARLSAGAQEAGTIFRRELVDQAEEVSRKVSEAGNRVTDELKPAVEALAGALLNVKSLWADILSLIADGIARSKEFASVLQTASSWARALNPIARASDLLTGGISQMAAQPVIGGQPTAGPYGPTPPSAVGNQAAGYIVNYLRKQEFQRQSDAGVTSRLNPPEEGKKGRTPRAAAAEADAVATFHDGMEKSIRLLEAETQAFGKNAVEREKIIDLAKAEQAASERGTPLTQAEIDRTVELAEKKALLSEQIKKHREAEQGAKEATSFLGNQGLDALDSLIWKTKTASQVAQDLAKSLLKAAMQAALLGEGSLGGIFGSKSSGGLLGGLGGLFGFGRGSSGSWDNVGALTAANAGDSFVGAFATGGTIPAGKWGIAGEAGPEPIIGPATVLPNSVFGKADSRGRDVQVNIALSGAITSDDVARMVSTGVTRGMAVARKGAVADVYDRDRRYG